MKMYSAEETGEQFAELLDRVVNGETIVITKDGKPVALLRSLGASSTPRVAGGDAGKVRIGDDFDEPLDEVD